MILPAGSFVVSYFRRGIPLAIKLAVIVRQKSCSTDGVLFEEKDIGHIQFDHDPALTNRPFDRAIGDFVPPQNDPAYIFATRRGQHLEKTSGRKEGAERTVTSRGSDVGEAARARKISDSQAIHKSAMLSKAGDYKGAALAIASVKRKSRLKPKKKIQSPGFSKQSRPFASQQRSVR